MITIVRDIGVTAPVFAFRTHAHGVDAEADFLQRFFGIEIFSALIVTIEFFFAQIVEILHDREFGRILYTVVSAVGDAEAGVQHGEQDFDGVDLTVAEILVAAEEVF